MLCIVFVIFIVIFLSAMETVMFLVIFYVFKMSHLLVTILLVSIICCSLITHAFGNYQSTTLVIGMNKSVANNMPIPGSMALLLAIVLTSVVIINNNKGNFLLQSKFLSWIGRMSYSIFIWHQVLLAFYRYSINNKLTLPFTLGTVAK